MGADEQIDRLYGLPLDEFVSERNRIAKELRAGGDRETAASVAKLKKPSRAAWAINRTLREEPPLGRRLLDAADALVDAQEAAVSGSGRDELDTAIKGEREAVEAVAAAARAELEATGGDGGATLDRVRDTLRAASGDQELRDEILERRVTTDRKALGFGAALAARGGKKRRTAKPKEDEGPTRQQRLAARRRADQARRKVASTERTLERARERLAKARELAAASEAEIEERTEELAAAREELGDAEAAAAELEP